MNIAIDFVFGSFADRVRREHQFELSVVVVEVSQLKQCEVCSVFAERMIDVVSRVSERAERFADCFEIERREIDLGFVVVNCECKMDHYLAPRFVVIARQVLDLSSLDFFPDCEAFR